jgi:hypothetical protein
MNQPAVRFLNRCFTPDETIALLLRRDNFPPITQRVVRLECALEPRYQAWLSYENGTGANIYVAANPLLPGTRKRTKASIASARHLYIDIDTDGDARLAELWASDLVPPPTSILSTSPGNYQALWRVEGFDFDRQEQTLKRLARAFGGDPACTDCNRVLRVPGFLNQKYDPAFRVTVKYPDDSIWTPDDFRLDAGSMDALPCAPAIPPRESPAKHSNSENDWAWLPGAPTSRIRRTTRNAPLMSPRLVSGFSKTSAKTTSSPCSKTGAASRFPRHFAPLVRERLRPRPSA